MHIDQNREREADYSVESLLNVMTLHSWTEIRNFLGISSNGTKQKLRSVCPAGAGDESISCRNLG